MKLNHLNLVVPDVAAARQLFETYFGFRHQLTRGANALAILEGRDGFYFTALDGLLLEVACQS